MAANEKFRMRFAKSPRYACLDEFQKQNGGHNHTEE